MVKWTMDPGRHCFLLDSANQEHSGGTQEVWKLRVWSCDQRGADTWACPTSCGPLRFTLAGDEGGGQGPPFPQPLTLAIIAGLPRTVPDHQVHGAHSGVSWEGDRKSETGEEEEKGQVK